MGHQQSRTEHQNHEVSFDEAIEVFYDPNAVRGFDPEHSEDEKRFYMIGFSSRRLLFVIYAERIDSDTIRIITARKAEAKCQKNTRKRIMEKNEIQPFRFGVVKENEKDLVIEINQDDYERDLASGIPEDELLKPGKHSGQFVG